MVKFRNVLRIIFLVFSLSILAILAGVVIADRLSYNVTSEYQYTPISYSEIPLTDYNYIEGKDYYAGGIEGSEIKVTTSLKLLDFEILLNEKNIQTDPVNKYIYTGDLSETDFGKHLYSLLSNINKDSEEYKNLTIENTNYSVGDVIELSQKVIEIGKVDVFMGNCNFYNSLSVSYNVFSKSYLFTNTSEFEDDLCIKYVEPETPFETNCIDCTFYPVDKKHPLKSDYAIEVINTDAIPGGQQFAKFAYQNLLNLYNDAKAEGHNMRLTSAYRSYKDQEEVYEGWVQYEMGFGKSRAQAESDANTYSALPGFSEHQLGTTADISSLDCIGIETVCYANERLWIWLRDNAYKYGFVMSYPPEKDELTGYIHEPWHYRFIGIDLAKEYKDKYETRSYPAEFLRNKKLY